MASPSRGSERTLTAVRSPLAPGTDAACAVVVLAGRAHATPEHVGPRLRIVQTGGLVFGRAVASQALDDPSATAPAFWELADPLVSSRHARLELHEEGLFLEDLGSKNGTFAGAERVLAPTRVSAGRPFFLGGHAFVWFWAGGEALLAIEREQREPFGPVPTANPTLALIAHRLRLWARSGEDLLLQGETGVGKEVYARAVHAASGRTGPFVPINCAALPRELVESELFGYRPGAHSTARVGKPGRIEQSEGGTLFLDEIGEMPPDAQAKLLRFVQDRLLVPLGSTSAQPIDVRIVSATNRTVQSGEGLHLRPDLLGRLGAAPVVLPPLRERLEDLGALAWFFLSRRGMPGLGFETPALRALFLHPWPLNVRELEKVLYAAASLTEGRRPLALGDLPAAFAAALEARAACENEPAAGEPGLATAVGRKPPRPGPSREELESLLVRHQGNVADVSRALGRQRAAVWRWIKRFGLRTDGFREK